jgi:excisionase family DNA binding protein
MARTEEAAQIGVDVSALPRVLKVAEVAQELRVGETTVRTLIARGELLAARIGEEIRIPRSCFQQYMEKHLRETVSGKPLSSSAAPRLTPDDVKKKDDAVAMAQRWARCVLGGQWPTRP